MKEIIFIRKNIDKWQGIEAIAKDTSAYSPDDIAEAYTDVTADLAFAYTYYPDSKITLYLNNLAVMLHNAIYRNKREKLSRFVSFWTEEVPQTMYAERRLLLCSFLIMLLSAVVGVVSQIGDPEFCRSILGDGYVEMTLDNIRKGKPLAVYGSGDELTMFFGITFNNIGVAFRAFAMGMLTSIGTGLMLLYNGVMIGCFETFFWQHGLLWQSFLAVFLHGTLELTAITVAGAGGLALGNGMIFPGTYPRMTAFRLGAKRGMKIAVGTVPVFIMAGFIESFLTRHTEMGTLPRLTLIIVSLAFVVFYYIILPRRRGKNATRRMADNKMLGLKNKL